MLFDEVILQPISDSVTAIQSVTPGASPYTYTAKAEGSLSIQGGTVSLTSLSRFGTSVTLGLVAGLIPASVGDSVTITYAVAPTLKFIPR